MEILPTVRTTTAHRACLVLAAVALVLLPGLVRAQAPAAARPAPAVAPSSAPSVYFRAPRDGAVVGPTFDVAFGLKNYGVAPAGVNLGNTGHFHVLIDVEPPAPGVLVPADSLHRHFGGGQIETTLTLAPGRHTLRLVLADHEHKMIGPQLISAPVRITVRKR